MRWVNVKACPSWGAYKRHNRNGEPPCGPCLAFVNDAVKASQARRGQREAEAAYRVSVVAWRAEHEASLRRLQERAVRQLVALLAEAFRDEREATR
jgi:hypothetical protein